MLKRHLKLPSDYDHLNEFASQPLVTDFNNPIVQEDNNGAPETKKRKKSAKEREEREELEAEVTLQLLAEGYDSGGKKTKKLQQPSLVLRRLCQYADSEFLVGVDCDSQANVLLKCAACDVFINAHKGDTTSHLKTKKHEKMRDEYRMRMEMEKYADH